jgi:hypothetical protein
MPSKTTAVLTHADVDVGTDLAGGDAAADVTVYVRCSGYGWNT